jgi:hypothetical protein
MILPRLDVSAGKSGQLLTLYSFKNIKEDVRLTKELHEHVVVDDLNANVTVQGSSDQPAYLQN